MSREIEEIDCLTHWPSPLLELGTDEGKNPIMIVPTCIAGNKFGLNLYPGAGAKAVRQKMPLNDELIFYPVYPGTTPKDKPRIFDPSIQVRTRFFGQPGYLPYLSGDIRSSQPPSINGLQLNGSQLTINGLEIPINGFSQIEWLKEGYRITHRHTNIYPSVNSTSLKAFGSFIEGLEPPQIKTVLEQMKNYLIPRAVICAGAGMNNSSLSIILPHPFLKNDPVVMKLDPTNGFSLPSDLLDGNYSVDVTPGNRSKREFIMSSGNIPPAFLTRLAFDEKVLLLEMMYSLIRKIDPRQNTANQPAISLSPTLIFYLSCSIPLVGLNETLPYITQITDEARIRQIIDLNLEIYVER